MDARTLRAEAEQSWRDPLRARRLIEIAILLEVADELQVKAGGMLGKLEPERPARRDEVAGGSMGTQP